jgi:hypothetical protein
MKADLPLTEPSDSTPTEGESLNNGDLSDTTKKPDEIPIDEAIDINSPAYLRSAKTEDILKKLQSRVASIINKHFKDKSEETCFLSLFDPKTSINSWDADRIFKALKEENPDRKKNVLLILESPGGRIEPAYQITKLCKTYSKTTFHVVVPRRAKSAATLIAIGADQIHMGLLGELGPIDPQLDGLPALGVKRSLEIIANICAKDPKSSDAFAKYLGSKLSIEQIGYCDRVSESAVQYAERLLVKKRTINEFQAKKIALELVYEYKDHGFVIDIEEARNHLGEGWIHSDSDEIRFGEEIYDLFTEINVMLSLIRKQRLLVVGSLRGADIWDLNT